MEPVYRCIAGIDVPKKVLAIVVRHEAQGQVSYQQRQFGTTRQEIQHVAAWLQQHSVGEVVMESTAQYWRPVWNGLEPHFRLHLTHPLKTRAPRGRKADFRDAGRITDRWASGDLEASFVPDAEQRAWRWLTRTRVQLKRRLKVIRNHVEGVLEQGGYKVTSVVSDIFGVSGWAMLERIVGGETEAPVLARQARGALQKKRAQLEEALVGHLEPPYRLILRQQLEVAALLRRQVEELSAALMEAMREHTAALVGLTKIPGVDLYAAQELLAETGVRAAAFPSPEQFASWIGVCPGRQESAGVCYSTRSPKGNRYLRRLLSQVAWAAIHTKDTFFAGLFARLKGRLEAKGAAWAVAHRIAKLVWLVLREEVEYRERGVAPQSRRTLRRKLLRLYQECERAGIEMQSLLTQPEPVLA
jgi:transposase